ncbi:MAG: hypothetical protein JSR36_05630 [Proteobacteria bacterium]|nr:hypothetical protein [Pseudomonadota bacterium]
MSRMEELESRRRVLIARCELQRTEMALRAQEFRQDPVRHVLAGVLGKEAPSGGAAFRHPLAWAAALAALFLLRRPRQLLTLLGWARGAMGVATQASIALRLLGQLRGTFGRGASGRATRAG